MTAAPWASDTPLDAEGVRSLLAAQFPALRPRSVAFFAEGWDCAVYQAELAPPAAPLLLRFPKRAEVLPWLAVEADFLPAVAPTLPVPVPDLRLRGRPGPGFPYPFTGYPRLPGRPIGELPPGEVDPVRIGRQVGELLAALHAFPLAEARRLGLERGMNGRRPARLHERVLELLPSLRRQLAPADLARCEALAAGPLPDVSAVEPVTLHADLSPEHLLHEPGRGLTGVIDWTDATIGDPAVDLCGLWLCGGEEALEAALEPYRPRQDGRALRERVRWLGRCLGIYGLAHGLSVGLPARVARGLAAL